ncbi:1-deoxy-D-xylulose 5-phosphate reductoisomerase [Glycomyces artemisiae]|uniref:1-deoxy-D-xylulose 5-phosphate reductoisomerase n=1 Tax=Glycomyces artemisiae TaxID=1076443 RepID=A0A2T0UVZ3_9ACTN|nr:1-deoxy-D-xylulose-5-phosphate reductoisomerase [Glycomyces artemisiae]PRY62080.1 1-deoxy-D-xylulose 5-phosphate reductoisomerase [Glycomyces artemisiae]
MTAANVEQREIVLLGSTGSIGTQAIDIVRANPDRFRVTAIGAGGSNPALLAEQAVELGVEAVAVADATALEAVQLRLFAAAKERSWDTGGFKMPKLIAGPNAMTEIAAWQAHTVLNGINGSIGLAPTLAALEAGRQVALANKESLVAGGPLVAAAAAPGQLVPVDSEHSALAQCLRSGTPERVAKLVLTASGGPFRGRTRDELADVTVEQALAHPTWAMGPVVTINSATMVNKALEVIEAHELFGIGYDDIDVVVHPQSVIHSMVEFTDGSTIAQASPPDMRLPIGHALAWPDRLPGAARPVDWTQDADWHFEPLDATAFPAVALAKDAGRAGGLSPAVYNAANEEAVAAFRDGRLPFLGIVDTIARVLDAAPEFGKPASVADVLEAENWARSSARRLVLDASER